MAIIDSLVACYELNEASGNALDAHDDNDLTDTNNVGSTGTARDFERDSSQYFTLADNTDLSFGDEALTIVAFAQLESKPGASDLSIIQKTSGGSGEYFLQYRNSDSVDRFAFVVYGATGFGSEGKVLAETIGSPALDTPYFVVCWHDPTNNVVGIQVNDGTANTTAHSAGIFDGNGAFQLSGVEFGNYFDGLLWKVAIWRRVLTTEEKTWLYNSGTGRSYAEIVAGMEAPGFAINLNNLRPNAFAPGLAR